MACFVFSSSAEVVTYVTCVLLGISVLMPLQAITSAPKYMSEYYKYVTQDRDAEPNNKLFWANIITFYNLVSVPTQALVGPTVLLPVMRKLSLSVRFTAALLLMMLEVIVILLMPIGGTSQAGAMVGFFIVSIAAGAGKSYLEATCYVLVSTMPTRFMSAIMFGCGFSGVVASTMLCIIKASSSDDYDSERRKAIIYFSLATGIIGAALCMALLLRFNSYAQKMVGEFRALKRVDECLDDNADCELNGEASGDTAALSGAKDVYGNVVVETEPLTDDQARRKAQGFLDDEAETEGNEVRAVSSSNGEPVVLETDGMDDKGLTTAEQLQRTRAWPVVKIIWKLQLACFLNFFVSLFIFPSLVLPVDRVDNWFGTIAVLMYNCGDATGRLLTSIRRILPSPKVLLIVACCRFLFIPFIFLCIYHYIPGFAFPYVFMLLLGLSNGFFGSSAMVLGSSMPQLKTEGQRAMAGQLMGISLLAGASAASLLAMLVVLFLPS